MSFLRLRASPGYTEQDLSLAQLLAGRCALAVDNARLFAEVRSGERRLEAALGNLADAVTLRRPDGRLVYANPAAAELAGCTPEEFVAGDMALVFARWELRDESGAALAAEDLPAWRVLAGERQPAPRVIRMVPRRDEDDERWLTAKATAVRDDDGRVALAVSVLEDITAVKRAERVQRVLADTSKLLGSSLDPEVTLHKVAWAVVPELADWCAVDVPDEVDGAPHTAAVAHDDRWPAGLTPARDTARRVLGGSEAALDGAPDGVSALVVPLSAGAQTLGAITLATGPSRRRLGPEDLSLAEEVGRRAGMAVANARLHAARSHVASTLQRSLLPPRSSGRARPAAAAAAASAAGWRPRASGRRATARWRRPCRRGGRPPRRATGPRAPGAGATGRWPA